MSNSDFDDDAPRWYWAADSGRGLDIDAFERADDRFVIAIGQRELWARVHREVNPRGDCAWSSFGAADGKATLADCMRVFLQAREIYGVSLNRLVLEFARVPVFAKFIKDSPSALGSSISNPVGKGPLPRPAYDGNVERQVGQRIADTLGLEEDWWR
ncbi:hypothetical protein [Bradyrhizobium sp. Arg816]|uniref:hypothetical protein n=1 Tax=Bradyrhizobium sp. Arg816 TaxID=2998491 RepID=UPI00249E05C6|nr:hypothetical protein [Bradyrhizobium sp. Arg816]MDI3567554.1 hypothetical protein [Bradyrhizobium sp. Arg816]